MSLQKEKKNVSPMEGKKSNTYLGALPWQRASFCISEHKVQIQEAHSPEDTPPSWSLSAIPGSPPWVDLPIWRHSSLASLRVSAANCHRTTIKSLQPQESRPVVHAIKLSCQNSEARAKGSCSLLGWWCRISQVRPSFHYYNPTCLLTSPPKRLIYK